jgi:hypothetical protein
MNFKERVEDIQKKKSKRPLATHRRININIKGPM